MKVPTYKRQTALPTKTGGAMLSASANPNLFGLPGAAMSEFGQTVQNQGLAWLKKEIEVENATELAAQKNRFEKVVIATQDSVYRGSVENWQKRQINTGTDKVPLRQRNPDFYPTASHARAGYRAKLTNALQKQAKQISSKAVRTQFLSAGRQRITTVMNGLGSQLRSKYSEYGQAEIEDQINDSVLRLARIKSPGVRDRHVAQIKKDLNIYRSVFGFSEKWAAKKLRDILSGADEHQVNAELTQKDITSAQLYELQRKITDGKSWLNLSVKARDRLTRNILNKANSLVKQEANAAIRADNALHKKSERVRQATFDRYNDRITNARWLAAQGKTEEAAREMPDASEIISINAKNITANGKDSLLARLSGRDTVYNEAMWKNFRDDIYDAVTEDDLEFIERQIRTAQSGNFIGAKASSELRSLIDGRRKKTPQFKEREMFAKRLKQSISAKASRLQRAIGGAQDLGGPEAAILANYETRVNEGMRPSEAFYQGLSDHGKYQVAAVRQHLMTVDPTIKDALFGADKIIDDQAVKNLTLGDIKSARDAWNKLLAGGVYLPRGSVEAYQQAQFTGPREGRITKADRMTVRRLYAMENQLDYLENYIRSEMPEKKTQDGTKQDGNENQSASDRNKERGGKR